MTEMSQVPTLSIRAEPRLTADVPNFGFEPDAEFAT